MKNIARFSVKHPTTIMMMVLAVLLLGYISFQRLGIDLLPKMESPRLFVDITAGERPPEEMERQLVTKIEATAARGRMVKNVSSIIRVGKALVTVEYDWQADMDEAYLDLQKGMADFNQGNNNVEIRVSQHDPNATAMITAILSHPEIDDLDLLRRTAENVIRNELIRLPGVAAVEVLGGQTRELEIKVDPYTLQAYGLTIDRLAGVIQNANRNMTGGSIVEMGIRYVIRGVSEFETIDDVNNLIVAYKMPGEGANQSSSPSSISGRTPIYLREVADVAYVLSDPKNIVRLNGQKCLALEIFKEARFNTIEASEAAREQLDILGRSLAGYNIEVISDQASFIKAAITEVGQAGLVGIFLAVIVLFVFLRRFGVTMVVSLAVPISVIATFNLMYFNGLSLNVMTLGGLALGAGMLVDNAIVVVENIYRHIEAGKSVKEASILGAGEVGGAITASTLTTVVVFLPIVYLHGAAGELFREQAWTVAFSLVASLFAALSVIPMLASKLIKPKSISETKIKRGITFPAYGSFLESIIRHRKRVVILAGAAVIGTIAMIPLVGSEFMPQTDQSELLIRITLPEGSDLSRTEGVVKGIEGILNQNLAGSFDKIYSRIGPIESSADNQESLADENSAVIYLILNRDRQQSDRYLITRLGQLLGDIPDLETNIEKQQTVLKNTLGTATAPLVVEIKGENLAVLASLANEIKSKLDQLEQLSNVETSFQEGRPEINIEIDRIQAAQYSLSAQTISSQLRDLLSGREVGQVEYQGEYSDIKLNRPEVTVDQLSQTLLETSDGRMVRLDEVATMVHSTAPKEITRNNQTRVGRVTAHIVGDQSFDKIAAQVDEVISQINLPPEYSLEITGEEALRKESFSNLKFALLLAIMLVYMVMAAQFESLLHPFVILLTIPLAGIGAVVLLLLVGLPFNIMSFIGIIMLAGIAVNDSIILIDRINQNRRVGLPLLESIVDAGRMRIRPIIMTSITTILALAPLTIGLGEGAALRAPMAVAVIGGLFSSTALTLIVIPAVYYLLAGRVAISTTDDQQAPA